MRELMYSILLIVLFVAPFSVITMKLFKIITWSWWIVGFSPIWIIPIIGLVAAILELILYAKAMCGL